MQPVALEFDKVAGIRRGEEAPPGKEALLRLRPSILALAQARLRSPHDAQDVVQETCLRVLRNLDGYRPHGSFDQWVFTIAANVVRDILRRRKTSRETPLPPPEVPALEPAEAIQNEDDLGRIRRAMAALDPAERAPLILHLLHGVPQRRVAEHLDIPVEHLRVRLYRAIRKIRSALKE